MWSWLKSWFRKSEKKKAGRPTDPEPVAPPAPVEAAAGAEKAELSTSFLTVAIPQIQSAPAVVTAKADHGEGEEGPSLLCWPADMNVREEWCRSSSGSASLSRASPEPMYRNQLAAVKEPEPVLKGSPKKKLCKKKKLVVAPAPSPSAPASAGSGPCSCAHSSSTTPEFKNMTNEQVRHLDPDAVAARMLASLLGNVQAYVDVD